MCPYQIEKNVSIPQGRLPEIPFNKMEVGDSIPIQVKSRTDIGTIRQRVWRENNKNKDLRKKARYSMYQIEKGKVYRIYRTA